MYPFPLLYLGEGRLTSTSCLGRGLDAEEGRDLSGAAGDDEL